MKNTSLMLILSLCLFACGRDPEPELSPFEKVGLTGYFEVESYSNTLKEDSVTNIEMMGFFHGELILITRIPLLPYEGEVTVIETDSEDLSFRFGNDNFDGVFTAYPNLVGFTLEHRSQKFTETWELVKQE